MPPPVSSRLDSHVIIRAAKVPEHLDKVWPFEVHLNEPDRRRAHQFRLAQDRARFILGRRLLGGVLAEFCNFPEFGPLPLVLTPQGRPHLSDRPDLQFSITHSGELVAVALAYRHAVGIDLELISRPVKFDSLAERIFNVEDLQKFWKVAAHDQARAFFQAWTAKEAWLKARGIGIAGDLEQTSVPLESDLRPRVLTGTSGEAWRLQALPLPENYCGNVAWDNPDKAVDFAWTEF